MKTFMVLYMAPSAAFEAAMKSATPEQQQKGMQAWMTWMAANKASLVEGGAPLGKTKRVDADGSRDARNNVGGYSIVQAETLDAAAALFGNDHPHLAMMQGGWIEVMEIAAIPGM